MDWFKKKPQVLWLCFYGSAALTGLTLVFPKLGFLEWFSMIPMLAVVFSEFEKTDMTAKRCYWHGFGAVYAYYFVVYHWFVYLYPMDFVGLSKGASIAVVLAGWLGLSLLQALPGGLIFFAFRKLCGTDLLKRHPILKPVLFAALWVIFEWTSTLTWMGVPWGRLYMGQGEYLSVMQSSSVFGAYFVSFLLLMVNGLLAYALLCPPKKIFCVALSAGLLLGNLTFGWIRMTTDFSSQTSVKVAVIQGNIDSHEKWQLSTTFSMMEIYDDLTAQAAAEGAELVVWPETAITVALNRSRTMKTYVSDLAKEHGITLLVGALYEDETGEFNSLFQVTPDGEILEKRYDKRHLVPFGEYVPMRGLISVLIPPLAEVSALDSELTAGTESALFETPWGKIGSMICFDSIYEMLGLRSVRDGAELMVIASNDSWFSDSAAVYQHQVQAQYRAIEEGRYMVRAANTGISTILSPKGEILRWLDPLTEGYAVEEVYFLNGRTVYSVIGNSFVYLCIAFCLAVPAAEIVRKSRKHSSEISPKEDGTEK